MESGGIFINYCRCGGSGNPHDHALFVETLSHELADYFGERNVFIDNSTNSTDGYPDELQTKLATCDVLLVVIHPEWLDDLRERRDRLTDGDVDHVHHEIGSALNGALRSTDSQVHRPEVVPILLEGAQQPKSIELPEDIRELALLQAFRLRFGSLTTDLTRLRTELEIHTVPSWFSVSGSEPKTQTHPRGIFRHSAPGRAASRGLTAAAAAIGFLAGMSTTIKYPPSMTHLLMSSALSILTTLLCAVVVTVLGRGFYRMERYVHSLPMVWVLIVRLAVLIVVMTLLVQLTAEPDQLFFPLLPLTIGVLGGSILTFCVFAVTVRDVQEDSGWPPRVTTRPMTLRRALVRLDHHLTSLWQPPLSRIQREQTRSIIHQLNSALVIVRTTAECTRTRRKWLRYGCPRLVAGYAVWLVATLGLAVASMHESSIRGDDPGWYLSVPIGVVACGLGIVTMELIFRSDRKNWNWFIEETENNLENQLLRNTHIGQDGYGERPG